MKKNARDNRPYVKPVTRIELSEKNIKLRWIAIVVLLAVAVVAIGHGFIGMLSTEPGWQEVVSISREVNCGADFALMYNFGADETNPTAQYKKMETLYSSLTESAYQIFGPDAEEAGMNNLYFLNRNLNETVTVVHELYRALEQVVQYDSRYPFLAPVYEMYDAVFLSEGDGEAAAFDPTKNPELVSYVQETAGYAADPGMISIELLGNNQVRLNVAEEYLAYAQANGIETFLDFGWMRNAFIIDYLAYALKDGGYTHGYLASYDGFTRNLDDGEDTYSINLFDRQGNTILMPARMDYSGTISVVSLRDYPLSERDRWHYYSYENGDITTVFLDPADGMSKSSVDTLVGYSYDAGCAEIVLQMAPIFTADTLDTDVLLGLQSAGIDTLWYEESVLYHTQPDAAVTFLSDSGGEGYSSKQA